MIIAVDFDGTIVEDKFPEIGKLLDNAKKVINALYNEQHDIIIWTCRKEHRLAEAIDFLNENEIMYTSINSGSLDNICEYGETRKLFAHVYIDDKNFGGFPGWDKIAKFYGVKL